MKSNPSAPSEESAITSASNPRENPCFGTDSTVAGLEVIAADNLSYLLPYAQFLYAERRPNPKVETEPDAQPEKLLIHFALAEVVVLGSGLKSLEQAIQKYNLKFVKAADRRQAAPFATFVAVVAVTLTEEHP